jgi:DNA repair exonuclease SbcCD ATPase subunit
MEKKYLISLALLYSLNLNSKIEESKKDINSKTSSESSIEYESTKEDKRHKMIEEKNKVLMDIEEFNTAYENLKNRIKAIDKDIDKLIEDVNLMRGKDEYVDKMREKNKRLTEKIAERDQLHKENNEMINKKESLVKKYGRKYSIHQEDDKLKVRDRKISIHKPVNSIKR